MTELKTDVLTFAARTTPGATAGTVKVYGKTFSGVAALAAQSSDGAEHQLTPPAPATGAVTYANTNSALTIADGLTVLADAIGTSPIFPSGSNTLALLANTTYRMRGQIITQRTAATSLSLLSLGFGGTAVYSRFYWVSTTFLNIVSPNTPVSSTPFIRTAVSNAAAALTISNNTSLIRLIPVNGVFAVTSAGTFIPQFTFSVAAPGGPTTIHKGSFLEVTPIGDGSFIQKGGWA